MSNSSDLRVSFLHIGEIPEQIVVHIYGYLIVLCRQCINTGNWCFAQNCIIWNLKISFVIFFVLTPYVLVGECQCSGLWRQRRYVPLKWWSWRQHDSEVESDHCGKKAHYHVHRNTKKAHWFITQYIIQLLAGSFIDTNLILNFFLYKLHKIKFLYAFRASSAHLREVSNVNCTCMQPLMFSFSAGGRLVHLLRGVSPISKCTRRPPAENENTRGCIHVQLTLLTSRRWADDARNM